MKHKNPDSAREHRQHLDPEAIALTETRKAVVEYAVKFVWMSVNNKNPNIIAAAGAEELARVANEQASQQLADMPLSTMAGNSVVNAVIEASPDTDSTLDINSATKLDPGYYANFQEEPA